MTKPPGRRPTMRPTRVPSTSPAATNALCFQKATVYQWAPGGQNSAFSLGLYNPTKWAYGYLNGNFALGFGVFNGTASPGCPGGGQRRAYVYLQCNPKYNATNPLIQTREVSVCVCKYSTSFCILFTNECISICMYLLLFLTISEFYYYL